MLAEEDESFAQGMPEPAPGPLADHPSGGWADQSGAPPPHGLTAGWPDPAPNGRPAIRPAAGAPPGLPAAPGAGWTDGNGTAHPPAAPWANGSSPYPPPQALGPPRANGSGHAGPELPPVPRPNGPAAGRPELPPPPNRASAGQPELPTGPWAGNGSAPHPSQAPSGAWGDEPPTSPGTAPWMNGSSAGAGWAHEPRPTAPQAADPGARWEEPVTDSGQPWMDRPAVPPEAEPPPAPPSPRPSMPLAWVDEPTAPGAPDLYASWPGMPGARRPAPGDPSQDLDATSPGTGWPAPDRGAPQPGAPGPSPATSQWNQPKRPSRPPNPAMPADPPTGPGRGPNPAMPADPPTGPGGGTNPAMPSWVEHTDPGRAPNPVMPTDPPTGPGPVPGSAMPSWDYPTQPGGPPVGMPRGPRTGPGRMPNGAVPPGPRTDPGRMRDAGRFEGAPGPPRAPWADGPGWEDRSGAPAWQARGAGPGPQVGQGPPANGGFGEPGATVAMPAEAFWGQPRGPRQLPAPPRARVAPQRTTWAGASGQTAWPPDQAAPPDPDVGELDPWTNGSGAWEQRPPRALTARPATVPGRAGQEAGWARHDEVELPESRVDRFGEHHGGTRRRRRGKDGFWAEVPVLVVAAVVLAVLVKGFLVQAFYIPSRSMEPSLDVGDRVVVNRLSYRFGTPKPGQVVIFLRRTGDRAAANESPLAWVRRAVAQGFGGAPAGSEDLIKRVIAGPGDVVQGSQGRVWVNGRALDEPYLARGAITSDFGPVKVPAAHCWVMGDNREDSSDSRVFGPIPHSSLVGRAVGTVWPPPHLRRL